MNQWKGNVTTQITLDDDFIVPDTMDDMEQVMLDTGEIQIETVKNQGDKVAVKGNWNSRSFTVGRQADFRPWAAISPLRR